MRRTKARLSTNWAQGTLISDIPCKYKDHTFINLPMFVMIIGRRGKSQDSARSIRLSVDSASFFAYHIDNSTLACIDSS